MCNNTKTLATLVQSNVALWILHMLNLNVPIHYHYIHLSVFEEYASSFTVKYYAVFRGLVNVRLTNGI